MAALAIIPYTLLAQGLYSGLITMISTVTMGTCSTIKSIYTHKNPDITKVIRKLDIERRLNLIESVLNAKEIHSEPQLAKMKLNDLEKTQVFEIVRGENDKFDDPIELCLTYLHEIIQEIHNNLTAINKKVLYHGTKWFSTWRTLNIKGQLEMLQINSDLLESRFNDLIKISQFLSNKTAR